MSLLAIDIETFSDVDLPKCGSYAYSDSPRFEILLLAYAFDDEPTQVVDLARGEQLPDRVLAALEDESVTKTAFNAAFERTCISRYLGRQLSPASWQCTAVQSAMLALPLTLDGVGEVLNIKRKKLKEGVSLLDHENEGGEMESYEVPSPKSYYAADRYEELREQFLAFVKERKPKLLPLAELLTDELSKSEASREIGVAWGTVTSRTDKLKELLTEFLENIITF